MSAIVTLKKGEGRLLKAGGAWIFDNEIDTVVGSFENGDIVYVHDFDGYPLGQGFINANSKIRVRILTRDTKERIDDAFWIRRIEAAWQFRKKVIDTGSCRLIFGEADGLPGLTVDKYEDVLVMEPLSFGMDRIKTKLAVLLRDVLEKDGVKVCGIYERSDAKERIKEGLPRHKGFLSEPFETDVLISENGVKYMVDVEEGQKTGFFLDQKNNRAAVARLCEGAKVLDCFTHTGSFALNAAMGGAKSVLAVDASETAICRAKENAKLNEIDTVTFRTADVFELLPQLIDAGEQYDVVILDPPAFAKSRQNIKNAKKGYREINRKGLALVKDGGFLATCSCSHFMTRELFEEMLYLAAKDAHVRIRLVEERQQAPDHPVLWGAGESSYLKFYIVQVLR